MPDANQNGRVIVAGSCIVEYSIRIPRHPQIGETVLGSGFAVHLGGKGANQATALSRLGANATFLSRVGNDLHGEDFINFFNNEGIDSSYISQDQDMYTGVCMPIIYPDGSNFIVVDPGAAMTLAPQIAADAIPAFKDAKALQIHLEIPIETVHACLRISREAGIQTYMNPAPITKFDIELLKLVDVIVPNETEAAYLVSNDIDTRDSIINAAKKLQSFGPSIVVITLGKKGALLATPTEFEFIEGFEVDVVDTTGAGDAFCAGLLYARIKGNPWRESVVFANACGAIATTMDGGIPSMPRYRDVESLLQKHNLLNSFTRTHLKNSF